MSYDVQTDRRRPIAQRTLRHAGGVIFNHLPVHTCSNSAQETATTKHGEVSSSSFSVVKKINRRAIVSADVFFKYLAEP